MAGRGWRQRGSVVLTVRSFAIGWSGSTRRVCLITRLQARRPPKCRAPRGTRPYRRGRTEAVSRWRRALAADRSEAMALGWVRGLGERDDPGPGITCLGISQAFGPVACLRSGPGSGPGFQKLSRPRGENQENRAGGKRMELWFQDEARIGQKIQDHPPMGGTRLRATSARNGIYPRGDLPSRGKGRRARHALVRHQGHAGGSDRDQRHGGARRACRPHSRPAGWHPRVVSGCPPTSTSCRCHPDRPN